jgi:lysophospholipase L1-like esterase
MNAKLQYCLNLLSHQTEHWHFSYVLSEEFSVKTKILQKLISYTTAICCLAFILIFTSTKPVSNMSSLSLLSIGDSYTIGESVSANESFPNQAVQLLRKAGADFEAAEIVAKTGWTTDELQQAINEYQFRPGYDFVTLLIGVNNQYRGRAVENYKIEFEKLLRQAIAFANGKNDHVIVLSIPDWGVTPFAKDRDRSTIAKEIDEYNEANKKISLEYHVNYLEITAGTREAVKDLSLLAADGLHPSAKEYHRWAERVATIIQQKMKP